ncbi:type II toxin-antitoxin system VapB family antitoxin [Sphingomonas sp. KR1UV-12]|uniref:Type II toxin-antitoxin system VapB family antitoxin n=1 Tax=Sphingomonas aurea TaxID=3063994 RepID=A0ABT9ELS2_9SPHN|nr:type II toxin-antitoxin system VapB family antitoxin [Sphingomonas sp. KR1UV-12]MDP1027918.1 type II toxin-antitoxin system VapB family antitoxin [Sphingomonas sp. KR1UV-12]
MGISIKHDEIERLIRELASRRGTSLTDAIGAAVRNELAREGLTVTEETWIERVRRIQERVRSYEIDPRTDDEIIGYDEHGLPR